MQTMRVCVVLAVTYSLFLQIRGQVRKMELFSFDKSHAYPTAKRISFAQWVNLNYWEFINAGAIASRDK